MTLCVCVCLSTGCGRRWRGKLHHPLLCADGLGGMSHLNGDPGDLLPGGPVNLQGGRQEAQTGCVWTRLLHNFGLSHQGLLSGRHTGCTQGKTLKLIRTSKQIIPFVSLLLKRYIEGCSKFLQSFNNNESTEEVDDTPGWVLCCALQFCVGFFFFFPLLNHPSLNSSRVICIWSKTYHSLNRSDCLKS